MKAQVAHFDLKRFNASFGEELNSACKAVIDGGWYIRGKAVDRFEREFAAYCGTTHCIGVGNGLDAITLMFRALILLGKLNVGDEVLVPANTFIASILGVQAAGLVPVLAEPNPTSHNLSVSTISEALTPKVRAILVVHLYGRIAPMNEIVAYAESKGLLVLEDAAQAHGAMLGSQRAGSFGIAAAFSFYPAKNLGALGDAGAVVTSHREIADLVRDLGNYGSHQKYVCEHLGVNSRLDEMQAAMLSVKLSRLDIDNAKRRLIANRYVAEIRNIKVKTPKIPEGEQHIWHQFVVECNERDSLQKFLQSRGIQSQVHYPIPPHQQRAYAGHSVATLRLPVTELLALTVLSLPMDPCMSSDEIEHVIRSVNDFGT